MWFTRHSGIDHWGGLYVTFGAQYKLFVSASFPQSSKNLLKQYLSPNQFPSGSISINSLLEIVSKKSETNPHLENVHTGDCEQKLEQLVDTIKKKKVIMVCSKDISTLQEQFEKKLDAKYVVAFNPDLA